MCVRGALGHRGDVLVHAHCGHISASQLRPGKTLPDLRLGTLRPLLRSPEQIVPVSRSHLTFLAPYNEPSQVPCSVRFLSCVLSSPLSQTCYEAPLEMLCDGVRTLSRQHGF